MTLQSSGTISISDVSVELGRASNATTSLNETVVRRMANKSSGAIAMSDLYGKTYIPYWHSGFTSSGSLFMYGESAAVVPSTGDLYITGSQTVSGSDYRIFNAKINKYGVLQWQRFLDTVSSGYDSGYDIAVDGSGNSYIAAQVGPNGSYDMLIAKYNSSGTIQWQRTLNGGGFDRCDGIAVDSSSNVYVCGYFNVVGSNALCIAKFDTNGNLQWLKTYGATDDMSVAYGLAIDGSGNIYVAGHGSLSSSYFAAIAMKLDSSGNVAWCRKWDKSLSNDWFYDVALDSSGNVYFVGKSELTDGGNKSYGVIVKYDSSGNIQWQREVYAGLAYNTSFLSVGIDSSGNVYGIGYGGGSSLQMVVKYNSSGTIQWQRTISGFGPRGGCVVNDLIHTVHGGNSTTYTSSLPIDGSLTGTYNLIIGGVGNVREWATSSYTDSASTGTDASVTVTVTTQSVSATTSSLTDSAANTTYGYLVI